MITKREVASPEGAKEAPAYVAATRTRATSPLSSRSAGTRFAVWISL